MGPFPALPEGERHITPSMAREYQADKRAEALKWVKQKRTAVDVGAHVGLWSMHLAWQFQTVHAFEPLERNRDCFRRNVPAPNVHLYACALGDDRTRVSMASREDTTAHSWVEAKGEGDIPLHRLDDFDLPEVDFLKVDCVGYELEVLRGARQTLERCRPCVSVEQKPGYPARFGLTENGAVALLVAMGAVLRASQSGVHVLSWN